jgi:excisionase family DNA binding protein
MRHASRSGPATIRARAERCVLNTASPSQPREPIASGRSSSRRTIPTRFVNPEDQASNMFGAATCAEVPVRKTTYPESAHTATTPQQPAQASQATNGLPNRLMTAFEVAEFIGCHEETVRRAYLRGLLTSQRFGVRGRRFHPADVLDWIRRGAPTRVS